MKNRSRFIRYSGVLTVALLLMVIVMSLFPVTTLADSVDLYWIGGTGNWSDTAHWATAADGTGAGHAAPTATNNVYFGALSFNGTGQTVTVDATAYCKDMDWTGAANSPTLAFGTDRIAVYGNVTFIAAMTTTGGSLTLDGILIVGTGTNTITSNGLTLSCRITTESSYSGTISLADALNTGTSPFTIGKAGDLTTNNNNITCGALAISGDGAQTIALGSSVISCTSWTNTGTTVTFSANTATVNISGTGALAAGNYNYNGTSFNLNGTAHTVSGAFTCATLTRNGTATKTDTVTFTSGTTVTCTTAAMIGNSATNRLLVQSSTLGTAATITATNWTGTANVDIMDITATNAVDLSAITGLSGDCGGNTNITFTAGAAQTSSKASTWSDATMWTSRVPLPQDDVTCSHTVTVDMPRIGKSITFTGTPTVTLGNAISWYGSFTMASGMTQTAPAVGYVHTFRGRGNYTITMAGKTIRRLDIYAPNGTLTALDDISWSDSSIAVWYAGGFIATTQNITGCLLRSDSGLTRSISMGSGIWTLSGSDATAKWKVTSAGLTFDAGTSTIILTNSGTNAQTFAGGGLTYNNVTVQGAGNYALTVTGSNTFNDFTIDASVASKTVKFTDGTTQTVHQIKRDNGGTNVITLNGTAAAGWNLTKTDTTPNSLDYLSVDYSNATQANVWYAGTHSTDGTHNTNWVFEDPTITVTTEVVTGVTMNKDGVTGGTFHGTLPTAIDGSPAVEYWTEYGLTALYGSETGHATVYGSTIFSDSVPVNLTPGATYHYREAAKNGTVTVYGIDRTFTFTLPTIATGTSALGTRWNSVTLNGTVSNMGVASTTGVVFDYGYTPSFGSSTTPQTISGTGSVTTTITGLTGNSTLYYRIRSTNGAVSVNGSVDSYNVPAHSDIFTGLTPVILISPTLLVIGFIFGGFFMIVAGARRGEASGIIIMGIGVLLIGVSAAFIPMIISAFSSVLSG